ncbi:Uncharacterized protein TCM_019498 [Theobroma cacao]|uniref:Uncharacterized protein n=1 Tax=Theobroma cacao TaxID=3641 RepID=A0A061EGW9_THECC|nr:Uncharacterized protein TCM_019498 [Theobroma cacao]
MVAKKTTPALAGESLEMAGDRKMLKLGKGKKKKGGLMRVQREFQFMGWFYVGSGGKEVSPMTELTDSLNCRLKSTPQRT